MAIRESLKLLLQIAIECRSPLFIAAVVQEARNMMFVSLRSSSNQSTQQSGFF